MSRARNLSTYPFEGVLTVLRWRLRPSGIAVSVQEEQAKVTDTWMQRGGSRCCWGGVALVAWMRWSIGRFEIVVAEVMGPLWSHSSSFRDAEAAAHWSLRQWPFFPLTRAIPRAALSWWGRFPHRRPRHSSIGRCCRGSWRPSRRS